MKKILAVVILALFLAFGVASFFAKPIEQAHADGAETVTETETETQVENEPTNGETTETERPSEETENTDTTPTEPPKFTITQEELAEIINTALNEQQKEIANGIADKIASVLGIDYNTVYLFVAGAFLIILIIIILLTKYLSGKGAIKSLKTQLQAQQGAYGVLAESKEELTAILQNMTAKEIGELINKAFNKNTEIIVNTVAQKVVEKLKIEENTIAELAGEGKVIVEIGYALKEALIAIAENNRDLAIKRLSTSPTVEAVNALALENEKLKSALGDEAVAKALSENKGA